MPRLTPAVLRTLDILELFLDDAEPLTAPEVARRTELPRSTVHELLATLVSRDYLRRDEATGTYSLGVRLLQLGNAYSMRFDLLGAANEAARELSARTGETVSVALREGAEVLYLAKIEIREFTVGVSSIGQRLPANCTGLGKALLAAVPESKLAGLYADPGHLPVMTERSLSTLERLEADLRAVRARGGIAFEYEESQPGVCCAAAQVHGADGEVMAAISVSVPKVRWELQPESHWAELVSASAARLSQQLGHEAAARA